MENKRILIIPDLYRGNSSGANVTQVLTGILKNNGWKIGIYSAEFKNHEISNDIELFPAINFTGISNLFSYRHRQNFLNVIKLFDPSHILFDGSITNKPLCILEIAIKLHLHIDIFIFMQDFFCAKLYANDYFAPCTKCLSSLLNAFNCNLLHINKCKLLIKQYERYKLFKLMRKANHIITSTEEQVEFYRQIGIKSENIYKMPLPFSTNKKVLKDVKRGNYLLGIAQNRVEKGFHLVPLIMKYTKKSKLILAYYNEQEVEKAKKIPGIKELLLEGKLDLVAASWSNNLGNLIAGSCGIIIPSIWPTTTEYGLLETLAYSKPIVCFNVGIHKEKIIDGYNGFVANINDYTSFADKMDKLCTLGDEEYHTIQNNILQLYVDMTSKEILNTHINNILL